MKVRHDQQLLLHTTMSYKRQRHDLEDETDASPAVQDQYPRSYDTAVAVVRRLMKKFSLDPSEITSSFPSDITYAQAPVAPLVGLKPRYNLQVTQTFELHRSRIPTSLFKSIVEEMDVTLMQFGPLFEHEGEEARSRFMSPVGIHS
jgi:hypothetical protein